MGNLKERLELSHVLLPVSLIIIVSGYLELILDELGLTHNNTLINLCCDALMAKH